MAQRFDLRIEDLRKKSRTLIDQLRETSARVKNEISVLRLQSSSANNLATTQHADCWRMRNDSGGVSGALCPEYFHSEDRRKTNRLATEAPSGRIVLPSKGHLQRKTIRRKAVKECYCYAECRKAELRTKRTSTQHCFPCDYCKSNFDVQVSVPIVEAADPAATSSLPLSGEACRRAERITYSPTSEFLRRVQKKFSTRKKTSNDNGSSSSLTSSRPSDRLTRDSGRGESATDLRCRGGKTIFDGEIGETRSRSYSRIDREIQRRMDDRRSLIVNNKVEERTPKKIDELSPSTGSSTCLKTHNRATITDVKNNNIARKPRNLLRKTIRSGDRSKNDLQKKETTSVEPSTKRIVRTISAHSRCCARDDDENFVPERRVQRAKSYCQIKICPENHSCEKIWKLSREARDRKVEPMGDNDDKLRELNKFRNDNYFETHGSTQTLVASSRSSGSIEQYFLNDRLFPEAIGRIHRNDLVVTMPSCATKQRKRIHYFPRHIVKQDKNMGDINYNRKKRSRSCGLTGHAIDLGILKKPCEITNSLALRYQKGVTMANK